VSSQRRASIAQKISCSRWSHRIRKSGAQSGKTQAIRLVNLRRRHQQVRAALLLSRHGR